MKLRHLTALAGLGLLALPEARAGSFTADFNNGQVPAGAALFANLNDGTVGVVSPTGGVGGSGCLKLTEALNGLAGSMVIGDLDAGATVNAFEAHFKVLIGTGVNNTGTNPPADGFALSFADNIADGTFGEGGSGSGLTVGVDIYNNPDDAPAIKIYWNGAQVATTGILPLDQIARGVYTDMMIRVNPTGTLDVTYNGIPRFTNLVTGFQPITGGRFGLGARTGGLNAQHYIDDLSITTTQGQFVQPLVLRQPISSRIIAGYPAPMNVQVNGLTNPSFQWERKGPGEANFTAVAGAQAANYISPALNIADAGVQYRVVVGNENGDTVTSDPATFDVIMLPHGSPDTVSYTFDDGQVPSGANVFGDAVITPAGGVNNTGYLSLTEDVGGKAGTFIVDDLNAGGPVGGIDVAFKLLLTPPDGVAPADGFGFHWAPDLPEAGFPGAEEPVGTGLSVGIDTYNNGGGEAPAVDVFWLGARIGGATVPGEFLNTLNNFVDTQIILDPTGKVSVAFNGVAIVYQLQIPNWSAFSGARYGFSARTGGAYEKHYVDNIQIKSTAYAGAIGFVTQPQAVVTHAGATATFSVTSNDPLHTTYQWQVAVGGGAFTDIAGAGAATYTTPALVAGDDGKQFRVRLTSTANASSANSDAVLLTVDDLARPATAQILDTFDDLSGPTNTGTVPAAVQTTVGNALDFSQGYLVLTTQANDQWGALIIDDFNNNQAVGGFTAAVKAQIVGPAPADGWSFSWGTNVVNPTANGGYEAGLGSDLRVGFYTYDGSGRSIRINWRGTEILRTNLSQAALQTPDGVFQDIVIRVTPPTATTQALLDVAKGGVFLVRDLALPGFQGLAGAKFALAARTGGLNELHAFDDLAISTSLYVGPIALNSQPPANQFVLAGKSVDLTVVSNNPPVTTYQWQVKGPGAPAFSNIPGATSATYTTPVLSASDNGVAYQCVCTAPSNVVTSSPATITVVDPALPATWGTTVSFTNGEIPGNGIVLGTAAAKPDGGTNNTGVMSLTEAVNGLQGSFILSDVDNGEEAAGFVAQFKFLIGNSEAGNATNPPADGASFVWAALPTNQGAWGEGGAGSGLVIVFDTYDNVDGDPNNANGEAPAITAKWKGATLGSLRTPRSLMESGLDFRNVIVRVNPEGTLDLIYGDTVIFWHLPITNYAPITGASLGWGARTGGLNAQQDVDEIQYTSFLTSGPSDPDKPVISVAEVGPNVVVTFTGTLESSQDLITWAPMTGQTSPLTVPKSSLTDGRLFLRARKD